MAGRSSCARSAEKAGHRRGRGSSERRAHHADAQPPPGRVGQRRRERRLRVARVRAAGELEDGPGVGDRTGQRPGVGQRLVDGAGPDRDRAQRRLEPDHAAEGRRDADRAAGVGAGRDGHRAGGDGRARPGAGAARSSSGRVPRVAGHAGARGAAGALPAELGRGGLADHDRARRRPAAPTIGEDVAAGSPELVSEPFPVGSPREVEVVLHRDRDAVQRAAQPARRGPAASRTAASRSARLGQQGGVGVDDRLGRGGEVRARIRPAAPARASRRRPAGPARARSRPGTPPRPSAANRVSAVIRRPGSPRSPVQAGPGGGEPLGPGGRHRRADLDEPRPRRPATGRCRAG